MGCYRTDDELAKGDNFVPRHGGTTGFTTDTTVGKGTAAHAALGCSRAKARPHDFARCGNAESVQIGKAYLYDFSCIGFYSYHRIGLTPKKWT